MKTSCGAAVMWSLTRTEDLVSRHLTHMVGKLALVVGRRSPFLSIWASPQIAWASLWHGEWLPPKQVISESKAVATTSYNSHGSHAAITATGFYLSRGQQCFSVTGDYTRAWILGGEHHWKWSYRLAAMIYIAPMCKMHSPKVPKISPHL